MRDYYDLVMDKEEEVTEFQYSTNKNTNSSIKRPNYDLNYRSVRVHSLDSKKNLSASV